MTISGSRSSATAPLANCLRRIRAYTAAHEELQLAHHFLFDLPLDKSCTTADYIVMGLNPGEKNSDEGLLAGPTEESREFDFHDTHGRGRSSISWSKDAEYFCQSRAVVLAEFFFWSSKRSGAPFRARFGTPLEWSHHLQFCRDMNNELIEHYQPKAVVAPGLRALNFAPALYGLRYVRTLHAPNGHRLVEHFERDGVPWLFTKHWSGAYGFSNTERKTVRDYVQTHAG